MSLLPCPDWTTEDPQKLPVLVQAASAVYDFIGRQNAKRYVLGHGDLKDWHRKLFENVVPVRYYAGNYRGTNPSRPCLDKPVRVGPNFGVPPSEVEHEMKIFSEELGRSICATDEYVDHGVDQIARLQAAAHLAAFAGGSIIQIHPFLNGNGRIARFAMDFFIYRYFKKTPFFVDRPLHPDYSRASEIAMREKNFTPLYQYLVEVIISR